MAAKNTVGVGFLGVPPIWAERERGPEVVSACGLRGVGCTLAETTREMSRVDPRLLLRLPRLKTLIVELGYRRRWKRHHSSVSGGASASPCSEVPWCPLLPKGGGRS